MAKTVLETKVIIVGAGPAGAATSFFLTKYSIPHIVLEKAVFPRDKVCGDACSGKTALVINRANPDWMDEIYQRSADFTPSWGIIFAAPNGKSIEIPFTQRSAPAAKAPGFTVSRLFFDNFLFEKMASPFCTIFQNASVKTIARHEGRVSVEFEVGSDAFSVTAPLLIGADGDKSITRRLLLPELAEPRTSAVGLRAYYKGVTGFHSENFIELHFLRELLPGYFWIFKLPGGMANVGVGILSADVRKKKINLRARMQEAIENNPAIRQRFADAEMVGKVQGWGLPFADARQPISGDRFLLTGDAACLVDPFSGEGIGNAMYSGMLAAEAIKKSLDAADTSAPFLRIAYDDVFFKRMGQELNISTRLQQLCRYDWLFNLVVNKAHKSEALRNTISGMFCDMDLREQLKKPSFYFRILFNR